MDMNELQEVVRGWRSKNFEGQTKQGKGTKARLHQHKYVQAVIGLLGAMEEMGELTHCVLKRLQGIRGYDDDKKFEAEASDAVADTVIYLMGVCDAFGWKMQEVVERTVNEVITRNWNANKQTGEDPNIRMVTEKDLIDSLEPIACAPLMHVDIASMFGDKRKQTEEALFYVCFLASIASSVNLVCNSRKQEYNVGVSIREYWEINGIKAPLQMANMKIKRAKSGLSVLKLLGNDATKDDKDSTRLKVIDSLVDCISYAAFTVAELVVREGMDTAIFKDLYQVDPQKPYTIFINAAEKVLGGKL